MAASRVEASGLHNLPEELLLQVFRHMTDLGPCYADVEADPWYIARMPFRHQDSDDVPHPGLRAYPFLGQVCKRWKSLLQTPLAQTMLWRHLVVDFGHELVTAIHTPLKWSNRRPSVEEFSMALNHTQLSVSKIMQFVRQRRSIIKCLYLCNSEGFFGDEGEYLTLSNKHDFQASHLGYVVGLLGDTLQELKLYNCNDLMSTDMGVWAAVAMCPQLRVLVVEGINCRIPNKCAAHLTTLTQLESLSITCEEHNKKQWLAGLDAVPSSWSALTALTQLTLRGHQVLDSAPAWLAALPKLRSLDLSCNDNLDLSSLTAVTQLNTLSLQQMELSQPPVGGEAISAMAKRVLPDLTPLAKNLTALSLSHNRLTRLPACLSKLSNLTVLDVSDNKELTVPQPLTSLVNSMPALAILDVRGVHKEATEFWSAEKCTTMQNLADVSKQLRRRRHPTRVLLDT